MKQSSLPALIPVPFADQGTKNVIPVGSQIGITDGAASFTDGFPPLTMTPVAAGGIPPAGGDFNGILNAITQALRWACAGGQYTYDSTFSDSVGGYPLGALLQNSAADVIWLNITDENKNDPTTGAGWVPVIRYGKTAIALAAASVTLTPEQAAKETIVLSGELTVNVSLIMPEWVETWLVINNTTGNFTVSIKTASGSGVNLSAGTTSQIYGDGVNIYYGALMVGNNLAEIKAAGTNSQVAARGNIGCGTVAPYDITTSTTDSTVGHVLKVGDRGFGVIELPIIEEFDFKTYAFAGGETILINLTTAVNAPADIWSPSGWVYIHVTGVRNVYGDVSIQVTDFNTGNTTFFVCVSDANNPRTWYKGGLRTEKLSANEIQIENIDRATGNGLIAYYDTAGKLAFNMGYYQDMFSVNFYDETGAWVSNPFVIGRNGNATVSGNLSGGAVFDNGQRVYSPSNPQPIDLSAYATATWVNTYFLQGVRLSGYSTRHFDPSLTFEDGAVFTYMDMVGGSSNVGDVGVRYIQQNIYGVWYTVSLEAVSAIRASPVSPVPELTISMLSNFRVYQPTLENDVLAELVGANPSVRIPLYAQHFISEEGYDWYVAAKHLTGNVFIAFDATGIIRQIEKDVSLIVPAYGRSVAGLDALPDDANVRGSWKFDGETVYQDTDIVSARVLAENTSLRAQYAANAALAITTLQAGIASNRSADDDSDALTLWQGYLCDLRGMTPEDLQQSPALFPATPVSIF